MSSLEDIYKKYSYVCEHNLLHMYDRHTCDGCCASRILDKEEKDKE